MEDQRQFFLRHQVMEKQTYGQVAISMVSKTKDRFQNLASCSFDKGFHSPGNQEKLPELLDVVALPRKRKSGLSECEEESSKKQLRKDQLILSSFIYRQTEPRNCYVL